MHILHVYDITKLLESSFTFSNSIYGSAVCVYNMTAFNKAFAGSYKFQDGSKSSWEQRPNKYPNSQVSNIRTGCLIYRCIEIRCYMATGSIFVLFCIHFVNNSGIRCLFQCDSRSDDQKRGRSLVDAQQYQMMDEAVQPITIHPMFTIEKER